MFSYSDQLSFDVRCPYDKRIPGAWGPGDLNKMFDQITSDPTNEGKLTIFSQPPEGPWVITLDDFLTDSQCQKLIELGRVRGYERSKDVGEKKFDGSFGAVESKERTSSNTWCVEECYEDEVTQSVLAKISNYTHIEDTNYEYLQLLQYKETQHYGNHHDYIDHHNQRPAGVRILTVFLYLNDVEEGGGTHFTDLDITVEPKRGRVLIWPSVLDTHPDEKDFKTHHEALPVKKGIKYGANSWIHQRDFKTPYRTNCI
jgi:prolyl 4-hydroxylase